MLRLGIGLVLITLIAPAHASLPDEDYLVPKLDLFTAQFAHSGIEFLPAVQIGASVVFTHLPDATPMESWGSSAIQMHSIAKPQQEIVQATNSNWLQTNGGDRISLSRHFRVDFNEQQVNITVRSNSVLIEFDGLKIKYQSHSTSMVWSKAF